MPNIAKLFTVLFCLALTLGLSLGLTLPLTLFPSTASALDATSQGDQTYPLLIESWVCYANGVQGFGPPTGNIVIPIRGEGHSEFEAMSQAQDNCTRSGFRSCMVTACFRQ